MAFHSGLVSAHSKCLKSTFPASTIDFLRESLIKTGFRGSKNPVTLYSDGMTTIRQVRRKHILSNEANSRGFAPVPLLKFSSRRIPPIVRYEISLTLKILVR
ncbi:hypothetical protein CEXT_406431 [Caerostris extrusa]|uniref:Uncharacterized protein n=1 Tax=Caerostris extrusa TaxID=172846 RepID=A0AAV4QQ62_CAEEX|nr:hypothetical protein CEXT_406431 [Caerostris extrusa]